MAIDYTERLMDAVAFRLSQHGTQFRDEPFPLRAGGVSNWYFDAKKGLSMSMVGGLVGKLASERVDTRAWETENIAAMGIGGFAVMFAMVLTKPEWTWTMAYQGKENDPDNGLSGGKVEGKDVLLVDDVFSTGSSLSDTIKMIKDEGGRVPYTFVLVNRAAESALEAFCVREQVEVDWLFDFSERDGLLHPKLQPGMPS